MVKECKVEQNLGAGEYEVVSMIAIAVEGLFLKREPCIHGKLKR